MAVLLLSQAGAGKTARVQGALLALKQAEPLAKVWVLLSTERQIVDFRRRFIAETSVSFNIEYFNFYTLYRRILAAARQPGRTLAPTARGGLIRALLRSRFDDSPVFGSIIGTPGLARAVGDLIDELKQHRVFPDTFFDASLSPRELELAGIYKAYQQLLIDYDLIDREGEGWLAVEALQDQPRLATDVRLLVVDGYDQFNPLQAALLAELDRQVGETLITLTHLPGAERTLGSRFEGARRRLCEAFGDCLSEQVLTDGDASPREVRRVWLEAPDPAAEAAAVLRLVKRRLVEGCQPDALMIAVRDWERYGPALATAARQYGVPMALHFGAALVHTPAAAALIDLLALHGNGFRRRAVLDALRSPYFAVPGLDAEAVDRLEAIALGARVIGGRDEWLEAVRLAHVPAAADEDEADAPQALDAEEKEWLAALESALEAFFDAVTPPETGMPVDYVRWLEALIGRDAPDPDDGGHPKDGGEAEGPGGVHGLFAGYAAADSRAASGANGARSGGDEGAEGHPARHDRQRRTVDADRSASGGRPGRLSGRPAGRADRDADRAGVRPRRAGAGDDDGQCARSAAQPRLHRRAGRGRVPRADPRRPAAAGFGTRAAARCRGESAGQRGTGQRRGPVRQPGGHGARDADPVAALSQKWRGVGSQPAVGPVAAGVQPRRTAGEYKPAGDRRRGGLPRCRDGCRGGAGGRRCGQARPTGSRGGIGLAVGAASGHLAAYPAGGRRRAAADEPGAVRCHERRAE
ncbi:MAG: hypothetical protein IPK19_18490 [Chloroflexi bacterium]|nr:hypothetical protein [Chloroflexota bacterium]